MTILYLTHGMTGSGKTTFAKKFCKDNSIIRLSHDEIMISLYGNNPSQDVFADYKHGVDRLIKKLVKDLLNGDIDVFLDAALFKKADRDFWRSVALECGAKHRLFHVDCPEEIALERTIRRNDDDSKESFRIDENAFNIINSRMEALSDEEVVTKIDGTSDDL